MTQAQRTGVYKGSQKPVRKGLYERSHGSNQWFRSYWNGKYWCREWDKKTSMYQSIPWRGLAVKPKE